MYLEEALAMNPMGFFQYRLLFMCGLAFMADALEINLLTFLATCAGDEWGLSDAQQAAITGIVFAGIVIGTMFWGLIADIYGRRFAFFGACAFISIGGFLSGASPAWYWLIIFRASAGFGIGGANVPFDLLAEFLPPSHRGKFLIYIEYFWTLGSMFVAGIAWASLNSQGWRFLAYMTALPVTLASIFAIAYLPESPRWLMIKNKTEEAERVVRAAALVNGIDMPPFKLHHVIEQTEVKDASYMDLLRDKNFLNVTVPVWMVWLVFGFTYYGIVLFVGRIYSESDDDGDDTKCKFDYPPIFINAASEVVGVAVGALVIDGWGRKMSQMVFYITGGICVFLMGFETSAIFVLLVGTLGRVSALIASSATWVMTPEVYPTDLRTVGHASAVAWSKVGAFCVPFLVTSNVSTTVVGLVLALVNFCGAFACHFLPETKGIALDQKDEERSSVLSAERQQSRDARGSTEMVGSMDGRDSGADVNSPVLNELRVQADSEIGLTK